MRQKIVGRFCWLYLIYACVLSILSSNITLYFKHLGYSGTEIGAAISITTFVAVVSQCVNGYITDRLGKNKWVFIFNMSLILLISIVFFNKRGSISIYAFSVCVGMFLTPTNTIVDVWALNATQGIKQFNFAFMRSWLALGNGLFSVIYCWLLDAAGFKIVVWLSTATLLGVIITALLVPSGQNTCESKRTKISLRDITELFKSKSYTRVIIIYAIVGVAMYAENSMLPLRVSLAGGNAALSGIALFFSMLAQWITLMLYHRLKAKLHVYSLYLLGIIVYLLYFVLQSFAASPLLIAIFAVGNGISYGIFLPSLRQLILDCAPKRLQNVAQSLSDAIGMGFCGSIGSLLGGLLVGQAYGRWFMLICAGFTLTSFGLAYRFRPSQAASTV